MALSVVVYHFILGFNRAFVSGEPIESNFSFDIFLSGAPMMLFNHGRLPVCVFFVLSGYVLAKSYRRSQSSILALSVKRYIRLLGPIFVSCIGAFVLLQIDLLQTARLFDLSGSTWTTSLYHQEANIVDAISQSFLFFMPIDEAFSYNAVLWTMAIEFTGSLLLIFFFVLSRLKNVLAGNQAGWLLGLSLLFYDSYLSLFFVGALLTFSLGKISNRLAIIFVVLGVFIGTVPWTVTPWSIMLPFRQEMLPLVNVMPFSFGNVYQFYAAIGAVLVVFAIVHSNCFVGVLSSGIMLSLGRISFFVYLIHLPLLFSLVTCFAGWLFEFSSGSFGLVFFVSLLVLLFFTILFSFFLTEWIDRPSISLSNKVGNWLDECLVYKNHR